MTEVSASASMNTGPCAPARGGAETHQLVWVPQHHRLDRDSRDECPCGERDTAQVLGLPLAGPGAGQAFPPSLPSQRAFGARQLFPTLVLAPA